MLPPLRPNQGRNRVATGGTMPAPTGGWDATTPLASMKPDRAVRLDNWFPQPGYVEIRRGHLVLNDTGTGEPVETLMAYNGITPTADRLFAASAESIFDVSSSSTTTNVLTSLSNARWQYINMSTAGGHFLFMVNGQDLARTWDGTVWATPAITVVTSGTWSNVTEHKGRIWATVKNTLDAAYMPVNSIAGAASLFPLGQFFTKGGSLIAINTWTRDSGTSTDDVLVIVTSKGQVALYAGTDPASSTTWALIGTFDLPEPIGARCLTKVGPDLAIITVSGVIPLRAVMSVDTSAAKKVAITASIDNAMNTAARLYKNTFGWQLIGYPRGTAAILNVPITEGDLQHQYVMNTLTGAWCRYIGMNANCWVLYQDMLYFGGNDGSVSMADTGELDGSQTIEAYGQTAYSYFRSVGMLKHWTMLQPLITTDSVARPAVGLSTDFRDNATVGQPETPTGGALWDVAVWDQDVWGNTDQNTADWTTVYGLGQCASVHFKSITGTVAAADAALWDVAQWDVDLWGGGASRNVILRVNAFNLIYERGEFL